jgi:twitching motility protein PilI
MARKTNLREFQQRVNQRLAEAAQRKAVASKLGFLVAGQNWFVNLDEVSEVIPVPNVVPVPLTASWYTGIANVRGNLYSVVDFAAFQGREAAVGSGLERRVVLISDKLITGSGIIVSRMLGLRNPEQFERLGAEGDGSPWLAGIYRDSTGAQWRELDTRALVNAASFLDVAA